MKKVAFIIAFFILTFAYKVQAQSCGGSAGMCCYSFDAVYKCSNGTVCDPSDFLSCGMNSADCTYSGERTCADPTSMSTCSLVAGPRCSPGCSVPGSDPINPGGCYLIPGSSASSTPTPLPGTPTVPPSNPCAYPNQCVLNGGCASGNSRTGDCPSGNMCCYLPPRAPTCDNYASYGFMCKGANEGGDIGIDSASMSTRESCSLQDMKDGKWRILSEDITKSRNDTIEAKASCGPGGNINGLTASNNGPDKTCVAKCPPPPIDLCIMDLNPGGKTILDDPDRFDIGLSNLPSVCGYAQGGQSAIDACKDVQPGHCDDPLWSDKVITRWRLGSPSNLSHPSGRYCEEGCTRTNCVSNGVDYNANDGSGAQNQTGWKWEDVARYDKVTAPVEIQCKGWVDGIAREPSVTPISKKLGKVTGSVSANVVQRGWPISFLFHISQADQPPPEVRLHSYKDKWGSPDGKWGIFWNRWVVWAENWNKLGDSVREDQSPNLIHNCTMTKRDKFTWLFNCIAPTSDEYYRDPFDPSRSQSNYGTHYVVFTNRYNVETVVTYTLAPIAPTPTPTPAPPSPPTNLVSSCSAQNGTDSSVSWSPVAGATYYSLRINDLTAGASMDFNSTCGTSSALNTNWGTNSDVCINVNTTTYNFTSIPGHTYSWWVHARNASNLWSTATQSTLSCPSCTGYNYFDNPSNGAVLLNNTTHTLSGWGRICSGPAGQGVRNRVDIHRCDQGTWNNCASVGGSIPSASRPDTSYACGSGLSNSNGWTYNWRPNIPPGNYTLRTAVINDAATTCVVWSQKNITIANPGLTNTPTQRPTPTPTPTVYPAFTIRGGFKQVYPTGTSGVFANSTFPIPAVTQVTTDNHTRWSTSRVAPCATAVPMITNSPPNGYSYAIPFVFPPSDATNGNCQPDDRVPQPAVIVQVGASAGRVAFTMYAPISPAPYTVTSPGTYNVDILFQYTGTGWTRFKDTSFTKAFVSSLTNNNVPFILEGFDSDDSADRGTIDEGYAGAGGFVAGMVNDAPLDTSSASNKWVLSSPVYRMNISASSTQATASDILNRTPATAVTPNPTTGHLNIQTDQLSVFTGSSLTVNQISSNNTSSQAVLVVVDSSGALADITINSNTDLSAKMIIANNISIGPTVTNINAILIASGTINFGGGSTPLKIKGNILAGGGLTGTMRNRSDGNMGKPSVFVVFDPTQYLRLLPIIRVR